MIRRRRVAEGLLKPGHIVPLAELAANRFERADKLEANAAMQPNTALIGQSDPRVGIAETSPRQFRKQLQIECPADSLALVVRVDVGRDFHRPTISRAFTMRRAVGIPGTLTIAFRDEPLPTSQRLIDAGSEFLDCRHYHFEGRCGCFDGGPVDRQERRGVCLGCGTDKC